VTLEIQVAVAKVSKYAVRESGDTVEVTERPHGGLSVVLADGQGHGEAAKTLSNMVAKKAINLLADGTRDGAAARAVHDYLYAYRRGQVSAELAILSADLDSHTIVISRNTHCPALLAYHGEVQVWADQSGPIGVHAHTKPLIRELPIADAVTAVVYSDGIADAGRRRGERYDPVATMQPLARTSAPAQEIADALLEGALTLDQRRPADDMTVAVLAIRPGPPADGARRLVMHFPIG
jgi:serine phosphatase RsbU (regulator of sigma subunit)